MNQVIDILPIIPNEYVTDDHSKSLEYFILDYFGEEVSSKYSSVLQDFQTMLNHLETPDSYEKAKNFCIELAQFNEHVSTHFPISQTSEFHNKIRKFDFKWKLRTSQSTAEYTHSSPDLQQALLLFNSAAFSTQIAAEESRVTEDSIILTGKQFLWASGIFLYLKKKTEKILDEEDIPEFLNSEVLDCFIEYCVATSQQSLLEKTLRDCDSSKRISMSLKVCVRLVEQFQNVEQKMRTTRHKNIIPNDLAVLCRFKIKYYSGLKYLLRAKELIQLKKEDDRSIDIILDNIYAMIVKRLEESNEKLYMSWTEKKFTSEFPRKYIDKLEVLEAETTELLTHYKHENENLHHQILPESLDDLKGATVAKPKNFGSYSDIYQNVDRSKKKEEIECLLDPFVDLPPYQPLVVYRMYWKDLETILEEMITKLKSVRVEGVEELKKMGLPESFKNEDLMIGFPVGVIRGLDEIRELGGVEELEKYRISMSHKSENCSQGVSYMHSLLNKEEMEDQEYRVKYKVLWQRPRSTDLNKGFRKKLIKFTSKFSVGTELDQKLGRRIDQLQLSLKDLLLMSTKEMTEMLNEKNNEEEAEALERVKSAGRDVEGEFSRIRKRIERQIGGDKEMIKRVRSMNKDEKSRFISHYQKNSSLPKLRKKMATMLGEFRERMEKNLEDFRTETDEIMDSVRAKNTEFVRLRDHMFSQPEDRSSDSERFKFFHSVVCSIKDYQSVFMSLRQGYVKFWSGLFQSIQVEKKEIEDFVKTRKEEKECLEKAIMDSL